MKRALIVGVDHYPDQRPARCVADAAVAGLLKRNADGSSEWTVVRLVGVVGLLSRPLRAVIAADSVETLVSAGLARG